jgi:pimeloyl-ACP methyl ester carboxylesterase
MDGNAVERVFSLFTSSDRAVAMAGDLAEERQQRGSIWHWLHVASITFALWRSVATESPARMLALVLAGCMFLTAPAVAGTAAVFLFPAASGSPVAWISLSCFWWGGAVWTGASLTAITPRHGTAACALLAAMGAVLLLALLARIELHALSRADRMFLVAALGTPAALLAGGAIARRASVLVALPFAVTIALAATVILLMTGASSASAERSDWRDASPHAVKFATVDTEVQLEVLDWGGAGPPVVLLAGGGATAHQYDDFAPALTTRHRVVGLTRRGHRGSSATTSGYEFARLAQDVVRVMDAMGIDNAVVIGSSFAGEEMHVLGARHSARIRGLVYVDAAFDRGDEADEEAFNAAARMVPSAPGPEERDRASFTAFRAYLERYGVRWPEAYMRTRYRMNPDGTIGSFWGPERPVFEAMTKALRAEYNPYKPEPIRVPALVIYSLPKSADDLMRRGSSDRTAFPELVARAAVDPSLRARVEKLYQLTRARVQKHEKWFQVFAPRGRVVELSGSHDLIISNPREVLEQVEAFVASLPQLR